MESTTYMVAGQEFELKHYGIKGMKWGVRRQEKMLKKAEKKLGRAVKYDDFGGGEITNRGIRKVKKYDELEAAYKKVKKKGDPSFDYVHGLRVQTGTVLSDRRIKNIIKKKEKNPSMDVEKAVTQAHYAQKYAQKGAKAVGTALKAVGSLYVADVTLTGGAVTRSVAKAGKAAVKNAMSKVRDTIFDYSILDASGKVLRRFN